MTTNGDPYYEAKAREWLMKPRKPVMVGDAFEVAVSDVAALIAAVRKEALEEAAKECLAAWDQARLSNRTLRGDVLAQRIRALAAKETGQ